jgi:hypothetical protein
MIALEAIMLEPFLLRAIHVFAGIASGGLLAMMLGIPGRGEKMDCFVAARLAMTGWLGRSCAGS